MRFVFSVFVLIGKAKKHNNKNRTKSNTKATKSLWTCLIAILLRVLFNWVLWNQNQSNRNGQSEKGKYHKKPIRTQNKYMQMAWSTEKCEEQSHDWFERVAQDFWANHRAYLGKTIAILDYFYTQLKIAQSRAVPCFSLEAYIMSLKGDSGFNSHLKSKFKEFLAHLNKRGWHCHRYNFSRFKKILK